MAAHFEGRRVLISNAKVMGDFLALLEASGAFGHFWTRPGNKILFAEAFGNYPNGPLNAKQPPAKIRLNSGH